LQLHVSTTYVDKDRLLAVRSSLSTDAQLHVSAAISTYCLIG
jgi:hypothetical protein